VCVCMYHVCVCEYAYVSCVCVYAYIMVSQVYAFFECGRVGHDRIYFQQNRTISSKQHCMYSLQTYAAVPPPRFAA